MKRFWPLLLLCAVTSPLLAQNDAATVTKIIAMEKAWNQAFKLRDTKAVDALLDDGIVLVNDDGSLLAKGVFLSSIRDSKSSDEEQVTPESISVHVIGGVAIATGV